MPKRALDLVGKTFGRLVVVSRDYRRFGKNPYWLCQCVCDSSEVSVDGSSLKRGYTTSCGCKGRESKPKRSTKYVDLTGRVFGSKTVTGRDLDRAGTSAAWWCKCTCGKIVSKMTGDLKKIGARNTACGCDRAERYRQLSARRVAAITTHGHAKTKANTSEYSSWRNMISRCTNQNHPSFKDYGGRGISVCGRWLGKYGFQNFLEDMGRRPSPAHSIDRRENNGNYELANCRWATRAEQDNNKRDNVVVAAFGKRMTMTEWGKETGIPPRTLRSRLNSKTFTIEEALTEPVGQRMKRHPRPPLLNDATFYVARFSAVI